MGTPIDDLQGIDQPCVPTGDYQFNFFSLKPPFMQLPQESLPGFWLSLEGTRKNIVLFFKHHV